MAKKKSEWLDWIKALIIAGLLAFVVRMFFFAPIVVDGPSMLPTLENGDHMIVNKFSYTIGDPERFDIVVFHATLDKDYIKRVIGLPGETVEVKDEILYINGEEVDEPFLNDKIAQITNNQVYTFDFTMEDIPGEYQTIPDDHVLVLGDNRSNSTDSRLLGLISYDQLVGETSIIYWPPNRIGFTKE
ncbi:signal peptidase I [Aquibacillus rhizosphaerae]|uniref:Signal peptidase I n=1 Tax=Aquibacillus rhizosphaerae TaxID=3051431 RepID=A0ABT7L2H9_9BACI|nr:signal peptidase I [Aquibacillus sp. LR5S19]MDL4840043.1 signal peptidase I [Aquibacillus sp. LR5S19]